MSYDNGISFGYDQIFVNPAASAHFPNYSSNYSSAKIGRNEVERDLMKKIRELESSSELNNIKEQNQEYNTNSQFAQIQGGCSNCKNSTNNVNGINKIDNEILRRSLFDLQRKNDMLTMFIVFLVVFVFMQYNTLNYSMHYANTLSVARLATGNSPDAPSNPVSPAAPV